MVWPRRAGAKKHWRSSAGISALVLAALALPGPEAGGGPASGLGPAQLSAGGEPSDAQSVPASSDRAARQPARSSAYAVAVPRPMPPRLAVLPFANRSGAPSLTWMEAALGFMAGELAAGHRGVTPAFGGLVVPRDRPPTDDPAEIAELAGRSGAELIVGGHFRRPEWKLELTVELWRVRGGVASKVGSRVSGGEFEQVHELLGASLVALFAAAGVPVSTADLDAVERSPTTDFYAFTLFGRGLTALLGQRGGVDWTGARKNLERAIYIDPTLIEAHRVLGELYLGFGRTRSASTSRKPTDWGQLARARFDAVLAARPHDVAATLALARHAEQTDRLERARDLLLAAVIKRPFDMEARYRLGKVLWDRGQADDSFAVLSQVIGDRPDDVRARRILVLIHSARGSGDELVAELEQVVRLEPADARSQMELGAAYAAVGRDREAIAAYGRVVDREPANNNALKFLGDLHKKTGDRERAIELYVRAMRAAPADPRPYFILGTMYVEAGDDASAKRIYQRALRFRRFHAEVHANLGAIAYRDGDLGEALWYHRRAVQAEPKRLRFRYNLGLALSAAGLTDDALEQVGAGLRLDPEHAELTYLKGVVLLRIGDVRAAAEQFERALELEPEHQGALHNLELLEEMRRRGEEGEGARERRR